MKKILASLVVVSIAAVGLIGGTTAYFSDTETMANNYLTTGTIDIAVDGANPWEVSAPYTLDDMKPGYVDYIDFAITNVGDNPANIWKDITVTDWINDPVSEPECLAEYGTYTTVCTGNTPVADLEHHIWYDLKVQLIDESSTMAWEQILHDEDISLFTAYDNGSIYLGMLPVGWTMEVHQSYRMMDVGNEYQGDSIKFDISLYGEQLINTIMLEDKDPADWQVILNNVEFAKLSYGAKEIEFTYSMDVAGLAPGDFTLIAWEDPAHTWTWGNFTGTTILANVNITTPTLTNFSGSIDLNADLVNAKVWLVPGNLGAPGTKGVAIPWNPNDTLFETGLIDYMDADR